MAKQAYLCRLEPRVQPSRSAGADCRSPVSGLSTVMSRGSLAKDVSRTPRLRVRAYLSALCITITLLPPKMAAPPVPVAFVALLLIPVVSTPRDEDSPLPTKADESRAVFRMALVVVSDSGSCGWNRCWCCCCSLSELALSSFPLSRPSNDSLASCPFCLASLGLADLSSHRPLASGPRSCRTKGGYRPRQPCSSVSRR